MLKFKKYATIDIKAIILFKKFDQTTLHFEINPRIHFT